MRRRRGRRGAPRRRRPRPRSRPPAFPVEEEMQALARAARRRQGEQMTVATREPSAAKHLAQIGLEEAPREALERGADGPSSIGVAGEEELLERAVAPEQVAGGHAEGDEVAWPVEAIPEPLEGPRVTRGIEALDERGRRRAHRREHRVELASEEVHAAVGETRGQQPDELAVARIGVTERKSDGVEFDPRGVVEVAIEVLERLPERAR